MRFPCPHAYLSDMVDPQGFCAHITHLTTTTYGLGDTQEALVLQLVLLYLKGGCKGGEIRVEIQESALIYTTHKKYTVVK